MMTVAQSRIQYSITIIMAASLLQYVHSREETCRLRRMRLRIQIDNCQPKIIPAMACNGTCESFVRPSASIPGQIERSCQCCQEQRYQRRRVIIKCRREGSRRLVRRRFPINIPSRCMCRPCFNTRNVHPSEELIRNTRSILMRDPRR